MMKHIWIYLLLLMMAVQGYSGFLTQDLSHSFKIPEEKIVLAGGESLDKEEVLRFHVVAHSDDARDQEIKEEVTRELLAFMSEHLQDMQSREQARRAIIEEIPGVKERAEQVLRAAGTPHPVEVSLQREMFPPRQYLYGDFPAGEYDALRIVIGSGSGENWWCVLFPPLCFSHVPEGEKKEEEAAYVDDDSESAGVEAGSKSTDSLNESREPVPENGSSSGPVENEDGELEVRFRVVDWVNRLLPSYYGSGCSD